MKWDRRQYYLHCTGEEMAEQDFYLDIGPVPSLLTITNFSSEMIKRSIWNDLHQREHGAYIY